MWWNSDDGPLLGELRRLAELLSVSEDLGRSKVPAEIMGFGSAKLDGKRVPVAVLHEALFSGAAGHSGPTSPLADLAHRFVGRGKPLTPQCTLFDSDHLTPLARRLLEPLPLPADTRFMFVDWPRPCAHPPCPGSAIRAGERTGTLGLFLIDLPASSTGQPARLLATTAGHVIRAGTTGAPEHVAIGLARRWGRNDRVIGHVTAVADPVGRAGPDVAFLEILLSAFGGKGWLVPAPSLDPLGHPIPWPPYDGRSFLRSVALATAPQPEGSIGTLLGGRSGKRRGWIDNPLLQIRSSKDRIRQWTNCWTMFELGGGFAQPGDSGGLVRSEDGEIVGHLVASMGVVTRRGRRQAGIVQDIETILASRPNAGSGPLIPVMPSPLPLDQSGMTRLLDAWRR